MSDVVGKLWGFCHTLRHDGVDYGDYIEQLTYLLFLKMADEKAREVPKGYGWQELRALSGTDLADHYTDTLRALSKERGILADIFAGAVSRFNNPVNLKKLVSLVDETEWTALGVDVKAHVYEGLLEKAAAEGKKGAGQYFTPRILIDSIVRCMKPDPSLAKDFTIHDPAVGTAGFLIAAYEWLMNVTRGALDRELARRLRTRVYSGNELVQRPRRLALMNLYLHGIEDGVTRGDTIYDPAPKGRYDVVLTNPPFGTKGADQAPERDDFTVSTSNKQLNFLQHVLTILKPGGRAAVILPDNCLDDSKAGAIFEILMQDCNVHTLLRLPRGTFTPYSQGVNANVVFFQKGPSTAHVWIFDARSNVPGITKKERPLSIEHFAEFERCYGDDPNGLSPRKDLGESGRFRRFSMEEIRGRSHRLDIKWLTDETLEESDTLTEPPELAAEVITALASAINDLRGIEDLRGRSQVNGEALPTGWSSCQVGDVFKSFGGGTPNRARPSYWNGGIPWLSSGDIKSHIVSESSETISKEGLEKSSARICRPGSVLVVVRSGILKRSLPVALLGEEAAINQDIKAFDSGNEVLNRWLALALHAAESELLAKNRDGTTVQSVKYDTLKTFSLRVPPPAEQERILSTLEGYLSRISSVRKRLAEVLTTPNGVGLLDRLERALLRAAVAGKLVATEAELAAKEGRQYEPAQALLERVRVQWHQAEQGRIPRSVTGRVRGSQASKTA